MNLLSTDSTKMNLLVQGPGPFVSLTKKLNSSEIVDSIKIKQVLQQLFNCLNQEEEREGPLLADLSFSKIGWIH